VAREMRGVGCAGGVDDAVFGGADGEDGGGALGVDVIIVVVVVVG